MVEPFSLAAVGMLATTEGIKFLYSQAAEVLKRWREHTADHDYDAGAPSRPDGAEVLQGTLEPLTPDLAVVDRLHEDIQMLAGILGNYANGLSEVREGDRNILDAAGGLRDVLEAVYGQRITFRGEARDPSGPVVHGRVDVKTVTGHVSAVRARLVRSGLIEGTVVAEDVSGTATGVDLDTLGCLLSSACRTDKHPCQQDRGAGGGSADGEQRPHAPGGCRGGGASGFEPNDSPTPARPSSIVAEQAQWTRTEKQS